MECDEYLFSLDFHKLKDLPFDKYQNDFTFIVNGKRYQTNRIVADILSPELRNLNFFDSSINEFYINTTNTNKNENQTDEDYFQDFLKLATFSKVKIDSKSQKFFSNYFLKLGNTDEYLRIQNDLLRTLTIENAIIRLRSIIDNSLKNSNYISEVQNEMIKFIAIHFEEMNHEELKTLDIETLDLILNNKSLKLRDEDSLLEFILSLYEEKSAYSVLFEYVQFTHISENSLLEFFEKFEIQYLNEKIWNSICYRFLLSKNKSNQLRYKKNEKNNIIDIKEFEFSEHKNFNGIMNYLTKKTEGNINDNGIVEITSNSYVSDFHPKNLVDYQKNNYYHSKDDGNAIVSFDFKDMSVQLSSYSIKSNNSKVFGTHLKNWVIEASNDEYNWKTIDCHVDDASLNGPNFISNFKIQQEKNDFYRFVRLRQTGNSWYSYCNHNYIIFCFIEFYGKLKISKTQ